MDKKIGILVVSVPIIFLVFFYFSQSPGDYDDFAQCLTSRGFSMAGTDSCSSCQKQKVLFGKSFKYVDYHRCDWERDWCVQKGIQRYPTWVLPNGNRISGFQELGKLAIISGCELRDGEEQ